MGKVVRPAVTPEHLIEEFWPEFERYTRSQFRRMRYPYDLRDDARGYAALRLWMAARRCANYSQPTPERPWVVRAKVTVKLALKAFRVRMLKGYVFRDCGTVLRYDGKPYSHQRGQPVLAPETYSPHEALNAELDVRRVIDTLPAKHRHVLRRRYLDEWTLQEVADEFDVCRERIRQIEAVALDKLRTALKRSRPHTPALSPELRTKTGPRGKIGPRIDQHTKPVQPYASRGARAVAM